MNPVIGLDVAKGESEVQAFLDKDKPFEKFQCKAYQGGFRFAYFFFERDRGT